jgi:glycogen operon protein
LKGAATRPGIKDVTWLNVHGGEMAQEQWHDSSLRALGIWYGQQSGSVEHLLLLVNAGEQAQSFKLPAADGPWICLFDTSITGLTAKSLGSAQEYTLTARSVALLEC